MLITKSRFHLPRNLSINHTLNLSENSVPTTWFQTKMILCLETLKKGASFINMAGTKHHCINPEIILTNVVRTRNKNVTPYYCSVSCLDPTVIANIANRCQLLKVCTSSHFLLTIWEFYIIFCSFVYCLVIYLNNTCTILILSSHSSHPVNGTVNGTP